MFIGRSKELAELNKKYSENKGHLVVIYGKRRLGKTAFLKEFTKDKEALFYVSRETIDSEQIKLFSQEILENSLAKEYIGTFDNWEKAFLYLISISQDKRILLVIDEFPYIAQSNKEILSILQGIWDQHNEKTNLMCILTGSSLSYIEDELLSENSPLFGRISTTIKLDALSFRESQELLIGASFKDQVAYYSILGGVPRYLKLIDLNLSLEENIKQNFLNTFSFLYQEINFIMKELLRETSTYYAILNALAAGNQRISEISLTTGLDKTKINVYLKNLINLNIITKKIPLLLPDVRSNTHRSRYFFKEPFFEFYFRFIFPNISHLESQGPTQVFENFLKPHLGSYLNSKFQEIVLDILKETNFKSELSKEYLHLGSTWNSKIDLPVFGFTKDGNLLCGQGFFNEDPTLKDLDILKQNLSLYLGKKPQQVDYYIFSLQAIPLPLKELNQLDNNLHFIELK